MRLNSDCEVIFFVSSSGHCGFSCRYCIISPIAKRQPSLTCDDINFLLSEFHDRRAFLAFSGVGDFFAGYKKQDRFLERILDHDVEIALDINGAMLHEYPELGEEKLIKIRAINLTMHYHQIKEKGILSLWSENARILDKKNRNELTIDYVISPLLKEEWEEALLYFEKEIFLKTGRKILLVQDVNRPLTGKDRDRLNEVCDRFAEFIIGFYQEDFSKVFKGKNQVLCPAGKDYFRIWNDGRVQGCPNLPEVTSLYDMGNIKERKIQINSDYFVCNAPRFCDCQVIEGLGKMRYLS